METDYSMDMSTIIEISFYCYYDSLVHHPFRVFQILLTHQGHPKHGIQDTSIDIFSKQLDLDAAQHNETSFSLDSYKLSRGTRFSSHSIFSNFPLWNAHNDEHMPAP